MQSCVEQVLARIEQREGLIPWMYRDASGQITIGAGVVLSEVEAATRLPFQVGMRAATREEIAGEYRRVAEMDAGRPAAYYRRGGQPELEREVIEALVRTALVSAEDDLRTLVRGYAALPDGARMSLLARGFHLERRRMLAAVPFERRQAMDEWHDAAGWHDAGAPARHVAAGAAKPLAMAEVRSEAEPAVVVKPQTVAVVEPAIAPAPAPAPALTPAAATRAPEPAFESVNMQQKSPAGGRRAAAGRGGPLRRLGFGLVGMGAAALRRLKG